MTSLTDALRTQASTPVEVASRDLGGGLRAVASTAGVRHVVSREGGGRSEVVFETPFAEEAEAVWSALGAADPDWHPAYLPVPHPSGGLADLEVRVMAVGADVAACLAAYAASRAATLADVVEGDASRGEWSARFTLSGDGMKAAGRRVPGGVVMTWAK